MSTFDERGERIKPMPKFKVEISLREVVDEDDHDGERADVNIRRYGATLTEAWRRTLRDLGSFADLVPHPPSQEDSE